jgi:hypothetical protein
MIKTRKKLVVTNVKDPSVTCMDLQIVGRITGNAF